jgi:hypothetical protein
MAASYFCTAVLGLNQHLEKIIEVKHKFREKSKSNSGKKAKMLWQNLVKTCYQSGLDMGQYQGKHSVEDSGTWPI